MERKIVRTTLRWIHLSISAGIFIFSSILFLILFGVGEGDLDIPNRSFIRINFFLLAALLFILTRLLLHLTEFFGLSPNIKRFIFLLLPFPSLFIALIGYFLAKMMSDWREFIPFYVVTIFHLVRFFPPIYKKLKVDEGETA
jgi:uncharacterized membrane protein